MPIVLTQNERTAGGHYDHYGNVTGQRYQFPNVYKNKVVAGTPFVYYRGERLPGGGRRDSPEYFGCGRVGEVWRDPEVPISHPKGKWKWYCRIEDYVPFPRPIPWRQNGSLLEDKPEWAFRNGVRALPREEFERILAAAGLPSGVIEEGWTSAPSMPPLAEVVPAMSETPLLVPVPARATDSGRGVGEHSLGGGGPLVEGRDASEVTGHRLRLRQDVGQVVLAPGYVGICDAQQILAVLASGRSNALPGRAQRGEVGREGERVVLGGVPPRGLVEGSPPGAGGGAVRRGRGPRACPAANSLAGAG